MNAYMSSFNGRDWNWMLIFAPDGKTAKEMTQSSFVRKIKLTKEVKDKADKFYFDNDIPHVIQLYPEDDLDRIEKEWLEKIPIKKIGVIKQVIDESGNVIAEEE
jgi:hypothetical protein